MTDAIRDQNHVTVALGVSSTSATTTIPFKIDPNTGRLLVDSAGGSTSPGGNDTDVQFNDSGAFGGSDNFQWTGTLLKLNADVQFKSQAGSTNFLITVEDQTVNNTAGNSLQLEAADGKGNGAAGSINVDAGNGDLTGAGGYVSLAAGTGGATSGAGGAANITAGNALAGNSSGGDVNIRAGVKTGSGTNGKFKFIPKGNTTVTGILDFDSLASTDKTFVFPNTSGTVALTSQLGANITVGTTTITSGTDTRILYDNSGVLGEYTLTGTGTVVAMATAPTLTNPIVGTQAASDNSTKAASTAYVTTGIANAVAGVNPAVAVQYATTAAGATSGLTYANGASGIGATLTGVNNATTTFDGHTFVIGDIGIRVLVKNDTQSPSGAFNGVYTFTAIHTAGTGDIFTRALDYNAPSDINSTGAIPVVSGTANALTSWLLTSAVTTVGTDPLTYAQFSYSPTVTARTDVGNTFVGVSTGSAWVLTSPTITTKISPTSDDGAPLGDTTHNFSDLFLASGAVVNYVNSNVVITHTSGILTMGTGELRITTVGTDATSVPTLGSTSTLTNKTLTSPTIQTSPVLAAGTNLKFTLPADLTATGDITNEFNSGYSSTAIGDLVYLDSSATWQKAKADSATTSTNLLGIALSVAASAAAVTVLLRGFIQAASPFPTLTVGAPVYISGATAGAVVVAQPSTTDYVIRVVGHAVHADKMWFNPSGDWITHT